MFYVCVAFFLLFVYMSFMFYNQRGPLLAEAEALTLEQIHELHSEAITFPEEFQHQVYKYLLINLICFCLFCINSLG